MERQEKPAAGTGDGRLTTTLARGFEVLRCFRPGDDALTNGEIAARTGLPKPTITRLTHTLDDLGYLAAAAQPGAFRLGPGVLALGFSTLAGMELPDRARPAMDELARHAGGTVALGARDRLAVVYVAVARSQQVITLCRKVGSRLPIQSTAMGRAILAGLPPEERDFLLKSLDEVAPDRGQEIRDRVALAAEQIATLGFCTAFGELVPDINAIAAPVLSLDGEETYAINIGGPSFMLPEDRLIHDLGPRLAETVAQVGAPNRTALRHAVAGRR